MRELEGLKEIYNNYDTFIIDLWGVMHNGIMLNPRAIEAVENLQKNSKKFVFLSNAPRPSANVIDFLLKMKMDKKYLSNVMTSGEAAMHAINKEKFGKNFYHLGPKRDVQIFEKVKDHETTIDKCDFILCTGLFDKYEDDLKYYKKLLKDQYQSIGEVMLAGGVDNMEKYKYLMGQAHAYQKIDQEISNLLKPKEQKNDTERPENVVDIRTKD